MDLYTISKTYPIITIIVALIFFAAGFKIAKKLLWILAGIAVILAVVLWFW